MGFSFLLPYFHILENYIDDFYSEIVKCIKSNAGNNTFSITKNYVFGVVSNGKNLYKTYESVIMALSILWKHCTHCIKAFPFSDQLHLIGELYVS